MKTVLVNIVVFANKIENLQELLPKEFAAVEQWKKEDVIEHLFMKEDKDGVILILKHVDIEKAKELVSKLPLFPYFEKIEYTSLEKQF
ncbi:hypothetical protein VUJ46_07005 [Chryseobacterium sp. MYb264]|uniref:hypothetical protein n=1 Tax=Chryseobacterium sp. MYb264 TaxID=2745153 RepID=UPI002E1297DB|nr:hypothetical protein VUJ46_07005 [Chryseobacterium sp. MYb264]